MQYLVFAFTVIAVLVIVKLLSWPFRKMIKLVINIALGLVMIWIVNAFGGPLGIYIPFNMITALVSGILGVPGVICLIILNYIF